MSTSNTPKSTQNKPKCIHCKKIGHTAEKCWKKNPNLMPKHLKAKKDQPAEKTSESTLLTQEEGQLAENEEIALSTTELHNENTWILDSGATRHICAYKSLFSELRPYHTTLSWGKITKIPVNWIGTVKIQFESTSRVAKIENCLFVPDIGLNLLSLGLLRQKGISVRVWQRVLQLAMLPSNKENKSEGREEEVEGLRLLLISYVPSVSRALRGLHRDSLCKGDELVSICLRVCLSVLAHGPSSLTDS